ncbi:MAG: ABC transporter substrate-binding protein [Candidatus Thorarchaeota archaeon]|nr:ABC transporter substrate-binding protein [Candidatus Thorarchaeota archaeon]
MDYANPKTFLILGVFLTSFLILSPYTTIPVLDLSQSSDNPSIGPYLDSVFFDSYEEPDRQIQALLDNDADLVGDFIDPFFRSTLEEAESIDILSTPSNAYGQLLLNTAKYPLNNTFLRRAIAFALDKERFVSEVWGGEAEPLDVVIPKMNPFSAENLLPFNYHDSQIDIGIELLNEAGFIDINSDGYREAPDGQPFSLELVNVFGSYPYTRICEISVESIRALGVNCTLSPSNFGIIDTLYFHGDYDIAFLESSFSSLDITWLAYEFWSEYAEMPYRNPSNFRNSTFDSARQLFLYSTDYNQVYQASLEMQEIIAYECPVIVCYEENVLSAYRTDVFEEFVSDTQYGAACWWSSYRCHLESSPYITGGSLRWALDELPDSLNFLFPLPHMSNKMVQHLWGSLLVRNHNGNLVSWFATSYQIETHEDNSNVTEGFTRLTFEIDSAIHWSDGQVLDADDVVFTINYLKQANSSRFSSILQNVTQVYNQSQFIIVLEFDFESYWHLENIGLIPILPTQIFSAVEVEEWDTFEPVSTFETIPVSGPFNISIYEVGNYCRMMRNPLFFNLPVSETDTEPDMFYLPFLAAIPIVLSTFIGLEIIRRRRLEANANVHQFP